VDIGLVRPTELELLDPTTTTAPTSDGEEEE
jgi:hypothetical protein